MIIAGHYNGPAGSGNGGYSAGLIAAEFTERHGPGPVEVTLRLPPPLDTPLEMRDDDTEVLSAYAGERLVLQARRGTITHPPVPAVDLDQARVASLTYPGFTHHPFPGCFVCGPDRAEGDGLRLFPGRLDDGRTATPFTAPADITQTLVWAALDCPGGWAVQLEDQAYVLGRFTTRVDAVPAAGAPCVVVGAMLGAEGRKASVHSSAYGPDGELLATADAVWVAVRKPA